MCPTVTQMSCVLITINTHCALLGHSDTQAGAANELVSTLLENKLPSTVSPYNQITVLKKVVK